MITYQAHPFQFSQYKLCTHKQVLDKTKNIRTLEVATSLKAEA